MLGKSFLDIWDERSADLYSSNPLAPALSLLISEYKALTIQRQALVTETLERLSQLEAKLAKITEIANQP